MIIWDYHVILQIRGFPFEEIGIISANLLTTRRGLAPVTRVQVGGLQRVVVHPLSARQGGLPGSAASMPRIAARVYH